MTTTIGQADRRIPRQMRIVRPEDCDWPRGRTRAESDGGVDDECEVVIERPPWRLIQLTLPLPVNRPRGLYAALPLLASAGWSGRRVRPISSLPRAVATTTTATAQPLEPIDRRQLQQRLEGQASKLAKRRDQIQLRRQRQACSWRAFWSSSPASVVRLSSSMNTVLPPSLSCSSS